MAVGKFGAQADRDALTIILGMSLLPRMEESHTEDGAEYMKKQDIDIHVDLGIAQGEATVWTCDLTHDYITINADYRS